MIQILQQTELQLRTRHKRTATVDEIDEVIKVLRGRGWQTKRDLLDLLVGTGITERTLQRVAQASDGVIATSSKRGYCLEAEASHEALRDSLDEYQHRLHTMARTFAARLRRFHARHRAEVGA